jgi:hypothetical protein
MAGPSSSTSQNEIAETKPANRRDREAGINKVMQRTAYLPLSLYRTAL